jgi:hypothetical protein
MKDEVEDFLRRVAQMRAQAEAQAKGQQRPQPRPVPKTPPPPSRLAPAPVVVEPVPVEIVDAELADRSDRVSRRVAEDLRGTDQIAEHTRRLGAEVDAVQDKMQAHLHQVFDHQLGRLKTSSGQEAAPTVEKPTSELSPDLVVRMLRSPGSIRDAIVMSEILRRPEF